MLFPYFLGAALALAGPEALRPGDTVSQCVAFDKSSGHSFKPHCQEVIQRAGRKSEMAYNAEGLRDKDYAPKAKPGLQRILFVGPSRLAAPGLAERDSPPRKIEKLLRESGRKVEVINAGVEGYALLHQASKIDSWLKAYSPDYVIVHVEFQNTLSSDLMYAPYIVGEGSSFKLELRFLPWLKPFAGLFGLNPQNFEDFRKGITWQSSAHRAFRSLRCRLSTMSQASLTACMAEHSFAAMLWILLRAEEAGAKVLFLVPSQQFTNELHLSPAFDVNVFSLLDKVTPRLQMSTAGFAGLFREKKIPMKVLTPLSGEGLTLTGDYHFNEVGSELFARSVATRLQAVMSP